MRNIHKNKLRTLCIALGLSCSLPVLAAGAPSAPSAPVLITNDSASGSIELSNVSAPDAQEPVAAEPVTDTAAAASANPAAPAETTAAAPTAEAPKDPREMHRDKVMQMPEEMPAGTSAASRRYKKVDLATYRATMQGASSQTAPTPQGGSAPAQ